MTNAFRRMAEKRNIMVQWPSFPTEKGGIVSRTLFSEEIGLTI
jgi:hypothetical protein